MAKILIGGAGGAPSNNVIRSLRESARADHLIGMSAVASDLFLADVDERYVVPFAADPEYGPRLLALLRQTKPDFLHCQNDYEILAVSRLRDEIKKLGVKLFLPAAQTVEDCVNKWKSYCLWRDAGIRVPTTLLLTSQDDLRSAFKGFGPTIWLRAIDGGGGRGALPTDNYEFARLWIERFRGWGSFTAAELLTKNSVTWLSIWHQGKLVVAQTRRRRSWNFGNRTLSGITGITGVGETCSSETVDRIAREAIRAVDSTPHGIFGVDMTYDKDGVPNPTEINIARFFTTCYFFTAAGLNMPEIYCTLALDGAFPTFDRPINPLPDGLIWIRGMDVPPVLTSAAELEHLELIDHQRVSL